MGMVVLLGGWALVRAGARVYGAAGWGTARRWRRRVLDAPVTVRLGVALALASGGAHLALAAGGHGELTRFLFLVDGAGLLAIAPVAFTSLPWRLPAALLLGATVLAYLVYLATGLESADQAGLAAKVVEITALGLLLVPVGRVRFGWLRWSAVCLGLPLLTLVTFLGTWGVALARPDAQHRHLGATIQVTNVAPTPEQVAAAEQLRIETTAAIQRF